MESIHTIIFQTCYIHCIFCLIDFYLTSSNCYLVVALDMALNWP